MSIRFGSYLGTGIGTSDSMYEVIVDGSVVKEHEDILRHMVNIHLRPKIFRYTIQRPCSGFEEVRVACFLITLVMVGFEV